MKLRYIIIGLIVLLLTGCSSMKNSTWETTDGYTLKISDNTCTIYKDDKVYKNKCTFEYNANNTGKNVITICDDEYDTNCERIDYLEDDWTTFHILGRDWYKK